MNPNGEGGSTRTGGRWNVWRREHKVEIALFLLVWMSGAYFYHSPQHNENARWDQMRAVLEQGTLAIERYAYNTADVVEIEKNGMRLIYPNKAPGTTILGLGPFGLFRSALRPALKAKLVGEARYWHLVAYLTRTFTVGLLSALAAALVCRRLRQLTNDALSSALAVVAVFLGTIAFPYMTLFYSHQHAAAQLTIAFCLIVGCHDGRMRLMRAFWRYLTSGFLLGFSVATEYPTAILAALIGLYVMVVLAGDRGLSWRRKLGSLSLLGAGSGMGGLVLVFYNLAAFGRVFFTPYQIYAEKPPPMFESHSLGFMGVHWPGWRSFLDVLAETTVRPQRGLVYIGYDDGWLYACSPVLWLALPGIVALAWRRRLRIEVVLFSAMLAAYLTFNACYGESIVFWGGATSVGPRHVIPVLPFAAFPLVYVVRRLRSIFLPLLLISVFSMLMATATEPRAQYEWAQPWRQFYVPAFLESRLAIGVDGLFRPGEFAFGNTNSFNLGWWSGLPPAWQLAPLVLAWLVFGVLMIRMTRREAASSKSAMSVGEPISGDSEIEPDVGSAGIASVRRSEIGPEHAAEHAPSRTCDMLELSSQHDSSRLVWRDYVLIALPAAMIALAPPWYQHATRLVDPRHGLVGRYYRTHNWQGPSHVRLDPTLDFDWKNEPPYPVPFSVDWTGFLRVPVSGDYRFTLESDDGSTLEINDRIIVDNGGHHGRLRRDGAVRLEAGDHPIRVRFFNSQFDAEFRLYWTVPDRPEDTIPNEALLPPM
ncbi:MAG: hypothetical protein JXO72_07965 [Vicinamibacteria bacterium]|nr:hypothetical protein [Vicinamibacteria bacterium]